MKSNRLKHIPIGVLIIASFYIFGAVVLLISVFTNPVGVRGTISMAHGLSRNVGVEFVLVIAALGLVLAYGLISLLRWGFYLAITYSLYLCSISLIMGGLRFVWTGQPELQIYFGNFLYSALVVIYLVTVRQHFSQSKP